MSHEEAMEIAEEFLEDMNPSLWSGKGEKPRDFDERIWEDRDPLKDAGLYSIELSFANDGGYWNTYVDLIDTNSDEVVQQSSCYGVTSALDIANIIEEVCLWSELKGV